MKYVFFVVTFGSIYDRVLPLIEEKKNKGEIIVVATTEQIELFFKHYTAFKVIRTQVHPNLINKKIWYKIFSNLIRSKLEYRKLFKEFKGGNVYFFGSSCAIVIYSYTQKLSKNNTIYQYLSKSSNLKHTKEIRCMAILMKLFAKTFLNLDTEIMNDGVTPYYSLDKKFYDKNNVHIVNNYMPDYKLLDRHMVKLDIIEGKKILFAIADLIACDHVEETEFIKKINAVVTILNESFPDSYVVKPHPRSNKVYGKMQYSTIVPPHIPSEFLMKHPWEFIIGIESTALISATKQTDAKVISLIELFNYKYPEAQKKWRDYLQSGSENKILFPKQLQEFKGILNIKN